MHIDTKIINMQNKRHLNNVRHSSYRKIYEDRFLQMYSTMTRNMETKGVK